MSLFKFLLIVISYTIFQYIYYYVDRKIEFSNYFCKKVNTTFKKVLFWILTIFIVTVISVILNNTFSINSSINIILTISIISLLNYILFVKK